MISVMNNRASLRGCLEGFSLNINQKSEKNSQVVRLDFSLLILCSQGNKILAKELFEHPLIWSYYL